MNQIAKKDKAEVATVVPAADGMLAMIERAATDPNVDVDKMERLYEMYNRMQKQRAEELFNAAMSDAQSEMGRISTDATNPQTKSKYASYGKLDKALRPIYTSHGFSLSFDTGDAPKDDYVRVVCHVSHKGGFSRSYHADMPADGKGAKGGDVMTKTHASGAAMTYGMRYLLKLVFNVAIGEEDNDGVMPGPVISETEAADIQAMLDEVGGDAKEAMFSWLKIDAVNKIPKKYHTQVIKALEKRREAVND